MKKISTYLPESQIERLKRLAEKSRITFSEHIRLAIDEYLDSYCATGSMEDILERIAESIK